MTLLEKINSNATTFARKSALSLHLGLNRKNSITFAQLDAQSSALALEIKNQGFLPGQMAGIFMQRSPAHVVAMLAILKAGGAFFSLNPRLSQVQVNFSQQLCHSPLLFADNSTLIRLAKAESTFKIFHLYTAPLSSLHQNLLRNQPNIRSIFLDILPESQHDTPDISADPALALFTSGSTGTPKGVLISRQDLLNRVSQEIIDYELSPNDRLLGLLPFSFDVGLNQLFSSLLSGAELILSNSWLPPDICSLVQNDRITGISAVPAIWTELMTLPKAKIREAFQHVRYVTISGGDLAATQLQEFREYVPNCGIYKTYGQTETFRSGILKPDEFSRRMTSVGRAVKGTHVFIVDSKGNPVAPGKVGQIVHRGDGTMLGYVGDRKATRKKLRPNPLQNYDTAFRQPVIYTGDLGKIDTEGYLYMLGRKDKMLKINGFRIYPGEIQAALLTHEAVLETAVFGVKSPRNRTEIYAEVRCRETHEASEALLKQHLATRLPAYMMPTKIILVKSFPRTASGKISLAKVEEKYHV